MGRVIAAGESPRVERRNARLADRPAACRLRLTVRDSAQRQWIEYDRERAKRAR